MARHDEEHLRQFVAARKRGDAAEMRRCWEELVVDFYDRIDGLVGVTHRGRLDTEEHDLAVAMCMARFSQRLVHTFEGVSIGELVNACRTMAQWICSDVQRKSVRDRRHDAGSLDAGWDEAAPGGGWEAEAAERRFRDEEAAAEARDFLAWALPQLKEEWQRVLELTIHGAELPEITEELGISRDNAYQRRSRGLCALRRLKEEYDA